MDGELGRFYDAIENPRAIRNELPILRGDELRALHGRGPRAHPRRARRRSTSPTPTTRCSRGGFVYEMILAHEHQHNETMLQLLQMVESYEPVERDPGPAAEPVADGPEMVRVDGGEVEIGAGAGGFAYDNERPRHTVELEPF